MGGKKLDTTYISWEATDGLIAKFESLPAKPKTNKCSLDIDALKAAQYKKITARRRVATAPTLEGREREAKTLDQEDQANLRQWLLDGAGLSQVAGIFRISRQAVQIHAEKSGLVYVRKSQKWRPMTAKELAKNRTRYNPNFVHARAKRVTCITTDQTFDMIGDAAKELNVPRNLIAQGRAAAIEAKLTVYEVRGLIFRV